MSHQKTDLKFRFLTIILTVQDKGHEKRKVTMEDVLWDADLINWSSENQYHSLSQSDKCSQTETSSGQSEGETECPWYSLTGFQLHRYSCVPLKIQLWNIHSLRHKTLQMAMPLCTDRIWIFNTFLYEIYMEEVTLKWLSRKWFTIK